MKREQLTKDWTELNAVLQAVSESLDLFYKQRDDINDNITESERYQDRLLSKRAELAKKLLEPDPVGVAYSKNGKNKVTVTYRR